MFRALVDDYVRLNGICRIIDLGGTIEFWDVWGHELGETPVEILCVNIEAQPEVGTVPGIRSIRADARELSDIPDGSYDIAFSNSVIEHVGRWTDMERFAAEARRIARSCFIQTPNFWFPFEPHARLPLVHWLPDPIAYRLHMTARTGFYPKAEDVGSAMDSVQDARLLDQRQFQHLFPDAEIRGERFIGLTKSLLAIRHDAPGLAQRQPDADTAGEERRRLCA